RQLETVTSEAQFMPFAEHREENTAAFIDAENNLIINAENDPLKMPRADLALNGLHNLYNSMAAGLSAKLIGVKNEDIARALADFEGVPHRLEPVAEINGVHWINDSKATNVNSCWYALESMPQSKTTVLILGGKDKGNDYSEILPLVQSKVKAIVAMGLHNEKIMEFFKGHVPEMVSTDSLTAAIEACRNLSSAGDTVLLSPCCASFDLFSSYVDRGNKFKQAVNSLK
ncbi:MAG: UDP-N-acetylmuramoyl-L-alanine--D-glutamate ligase, partial [Muribaculaceae bacterium]|nr:UDP-N-acetylmuramoyl-L-alanine--D-glutamate ligase [Muribaculaceae bacterium]